MILELFHVDYPLLALFVGIVMMVMQGWHAVDSEASMKLPLQPLDW